MLKSFLTLENEEKHEKEEDECSAVRVQLKVEKDTFGSPLSALYVLINLLFTFIVPNAMVVSKAKNECPCELLLRC